MTISMRRMLAFVLAALMLLSICSLSLAETGAGVVSGDIADGANGSMPEDAANGTDSSSDDDTVNDHTEDTTSDTTDGGDSVISEATSPFIMFAGMKLLMGTDEVLDELKAFELKYMYESVDGGVNAAAEYVDVAKANEVAYAPVGSTISITKSSGDVSTDNANSNSFLTYKDSDGIEQDVLTSEGSPASISDIADGFFRFDEAAFAALNEGVVVENDATVLKLPYQRPRVTVTLTALSEGQLGFKEEKIDFNVINNYDISNYAMMSTQNEQVNDDAGSQTVDLMTFTAKYGQDIRAILQQVENGFDRPVEGWYTVDDATGEYIPIASSTITKDSVLYAKFSTAETTTVTISNVVRGGLVGQNYDFEFTVKVPAKSDGSEFTEPEMYNAGKDNEYEVKDDGIVTFSLKNGESVTIEDIPSEAVVAVKEAPLSQGNLGYTIKYSIDGSESDAAADAEVDLKAGQSITFYNILVDAPDMGVLLDTLPYLLILGAAVIGIIIFIVRKRNRDEEDG